MRGSASGFLRRGAALCFGIGFAAPVLAQPPLLTPAPIWTTSTSERTSGIAVADVDLDGDLDLVRANFEDPPSLYLNDNGTLQSTVAWSGGATEAAKCIAVGDVNRDGRPDLVLATNQDLAIFYAMQDAPFFAPAPNVRIPVTQAAEDIALVDVDGDHDLDLLMASSTESMVLRNEGGFERDPFWSVPVGAARLAVGDIDGDGDPDLVTSRPGTDLRLYRGTGTSFEVTPAWTLDDAGTAGIALGDLDADGDLDLAAAGYIASETRFYQNLGTTFANAPAGTIAGEDSTLAVALGDADADGDLDLACANQDRSRVYLSAGGFQGWTVTWTSTTIRADRAAWADIDGDGDRDVLLARGPIDLFGNLESLFLSSTIVTPIQGKPLLLADIDQDGFVDLVTTRLGIGVSLHRGNGRTFATTPAWVGGTEAHEAALGDVNSDGRPDLVFAASGGIAAYLQQDSLFAPEPDLMLSADATSLDLGDVDADGDVDLVIGGGGGLAFHANRNGTYSPIPDWSAEANRIVSVALADVNGDGQLDLAAAGDFNTSLYFFSEGGFGSSNWSVSSAARVLFGDLDGDGGLDLVAARISGLSAAYRNIDGQLDTNPFWTAPGPRVHADAALADPDADGDLDLLMLDGISTTSEIYRNDHGVFASPAPLPTLTADAWQVGDLDADGDVDIVAGEEAGTIRINPGARGPAYRGDPLDPTQQRPGNEPFVRDVRLGSVRDNILPITFTTIDVEADSVWIVPEFEPQGRGEWDLVGGDFARGLLGPLAASPAGVEHAVDWDLSRIPSTQLPLELRLRAVSTRSPSGETQLVASYLHDVGPVVVRRPEIEVIPNQIELPTITAGDTASTLIQIRNHGNEPLMVSRIDFENTRMMRTNPPAPFEIAPGSRVEMFVHYEPTASERSIPPGAPKYLFIHSNDPVFARAVVEIEAQALDLEVQARALLPGRIAPLGEPIVVQAIPRPFVHVERAMLFHSTLEQRVATRWDSIPMDALGGTFIAAIPGIQVTELGLQFFVRVENSNVVSTDPPGAPADSIFKQGVERPATFETQPQPTSRSDFLVGRDINVDVLLPQGAEFVSGNLHYREGGQTEYSTEPVLIDFLQGVIRGTIPADRVGPRGLEFWVDVQTLVTNLVHPDDYVVSPDTIRTLAPTFKEPSVHPGERYRILSVPLDFSLEPNRTLDAMLSDEPGFGSYDPMRWRVFRYIPGTGNVERRLGDPEFEVMPGRAFWLVSRDDHQIDPAPVDGLSVSTTRPFSLVVKPGWNAVGSPFGFPVAWDVVTRSAAIEPPVAFDPRRGSAGEYVPEPADKLAPFEGYFVWNNGAQAETLLVPPVATDSGATVQRKASRPALDGWFDVTARAGSVQDTGNRAGIDARARDGLDALDLHEPPTPPGRWVAAGFVVDETAPDGTSGSSTHRLRQDVRPPSLEGRAWMLELRSSTAGEEVEIDLGWNGVWPADWSIALVDLEQGSIVAPEAGVVRDGTWPHALRILSHGPDRPYRVRLLAGRPDWLARTSREAVDAPPRVLLFQNAPNPFNATTRLRFGLPRAGHVTLEIYDVRGRRIATLLDQAFEAGWQSVLWNGRDTHGRPVASGVYLYRLRTPEETLTRRMMLVE